MLFNNNSSGSQNEEQGQEEVVVENLPQILLDDQTLVNELDVQAENEFNSAFSKSREWREDSLFYGIAISYKDSIDRDNGKNTYIFYSPTLPEFYWTITFDQKLNVIGENNFERVIYYRDDYFLPSDVITVPSQYWEWSYLDALKKADQLGGSDIRKKYPEYDVSMLLTAGEDRYLSWEVEYLANGENVLLISMSAFDGELY